jgi:hypothetical protein
MHFEAEQHRPIGGPQPFTAAVDMGGVKIGMVERLAQRAAQRQRGHGQQIKAGIARHDPQITLDRAGGIQTLSRAVDQHGGGRKLFKQRAGA